MEEDQLKLQARQAAEAAAAFSLDCQRPDGHWVAEVSSDATFTAEYVMFKYAMGFDLTADGDSIRRWLLHDQKPDGSWGLAPELPGNVSTTTEAYLALKILGVSPSDPAMMRSQAFMKSHGGVEKVRFFTRFFLATFGLFPWSAMPQIPAELILMPPSSPLNIYTLSSWARSTMIPVLVVAHHQPVYALPNGQSSDNDYLDELWVNPGDKNVPFAPPLSSLFWQREYIQFGFTAMDKVIAKLGNGLRNFKPLRDRSRQMCIDWLLEHQEEAGDWAGFFPPMHGSIWALILEGFPLESKPVRLGLEALERLAFEDSLGKRINATVSPVWDTALMVSSLCDAGIAKNPSVKKAADWTMAKQLNDPNKGDWQVYGPKGASAGWSFEYENTWYPDVDDTAVVVMALVKQDVDLIASKSIADSIVWMIGMQNHDGGWGAFDHNNDKLWLHKIPFSDMDSLCDPSSSDITGRLVECFGFLLNHPQRSRMDMGLRKKMADSSWRAIPYLMKEQEAPWHAWWGRWGNNYIYASSNVMRGLEYFARDSLVVQESVRRNVGWFEAIQNEDGGWGESLRSYTEPEYVGKGVSTAAQTAWALQALLPFRPASSPSIQKGIQWLVSNQTVKSEQGASWPIDVYTGTGFPQVLYLGYPFYHHAFPITALIRYVNAVNAQAETAFSTIQIPPHAIKALNQSNVLMTVVGSRGDIQPFLRIAMLLQKSYNCHVRIATHETHRHRVEALGVEFYPVGGSPEDFAKVFREKPDILASFFRGDFAALRTTFHGMMKRFWRASIDSPAVKFADEKKTTSIRPFVADAIASNPSTRCHVHAAEALGAPLVLVSVQPELPTSEFPHFLTMTEPKIHSGRRWNLWSYRCIDLVNSLAFYSFLNQLRVQTYGLRPQSLWQSLQGGQSKKISHACLWSPEVIPRAPEWAKNVEIAGYASAPETTDYIPPSSLETFLQTDKPVIVIGFGSMDIPHPGKTISIICDAVEVVGARAVICGTWPRNITEMASAMEHVYFVNDIPHDWLLPRAHGFVHHGGAGHTAAGMKAGVPMLVLPFFLDQNFWAAKVAQLGLGPAPFPFEDMSEENLLASLQELLLSDTYSERSQEMRSRLSAEPEGGQVVADMLGRRLETSLAATCCLIPDLKAQWRHSNSGLALSGVAAAYLISQGLLEWTDLDLQNKPEQAEDPASTVQLSGIFWLLAIIYNALIYVLFAVFGQAESSRDKFTDPVFDARIKQSKFDLAWVEKEEFWQKLQTEMSKNWGILGAARFHDKFRSSK
jgi:squalene-hopene/tetraprenyl-beta-curcumene cyclase